MGIDLKKKWELPSGSFIDMEPNGENSGKKEMVGFPLS